MRHARRSTEFSPISVSRAAAVDGSSAVGVPAYTSMRNPSNADGDRLDRVEVGRLTTRRLRPSHRHEVLDAEGRPSGRSHAAGPARAAARPGCRCRTSTRRRGARACRNARGRSLQTRGPLHHPAVVLARLVHRRKTLDPDLLGRDADEREAVLDHARRLGADREVVLADRDVVPHHDDGAVERVGVARAQARAGATGTAPATSARRPSGRRPDSRCRTDRRAGTGSRCPRRGTPPRRRPPSRSRPPPTGTAHRWCRR